MKFNKQISRYIILLIIINISFISSRRKSGKSYLTSKKVETKTKFNGSGKFNGELNCPYIQTKFKGKKTTTGTYSFSPSELTYNSGFQFSLTENDLVLSKFIHVKDNISYIPWRYFTNIKGGKKLFSYKYIYVQMRNDNDEEIDAYFYLPWKYYGSIVSEDQRNELVNNMIKYADYEREQINKHKDNVELHFENMRAAHNALESTKKSLEVFKQETESKIMKNKARMIQLETELNEVEHDFSRNKVATRILELNMREIKVKMSMLQKKSESNLELIDDNLRILTYKEIDAKIIRYRLNYRAKLDEFIYYCRNADMQHVNQAVIDTDSTKLNEAFNKIQPISE